MGRRSGIPTAAPFAMAYDLSFTANLGAALATADVVALPVTSAGAAAGTAVACANLTGGVFTADLSLPAGFRGAVLFKDATSGEVYAGASVNPQEAEYVDVAVSSVSAGAVPGATTIAVDHNYGGEDALRYVTSMGAAVDNADIFIYRAEDYDAGRKGSEFRVGYSRTNVDGRWAAPVMLDPADYVIVFSIQEHFGPDIARVTVVDA